MKRLTKFTFLLIFIITFVLYLSILLTSQSHVDGDEGVIGIMARHILTRGERPVFFYGQAYGGGAVLEAYLAVIPFTLFGESSLSLKLVAFFMSLATLVLTYFFCRRYCNQSTALLAVALLATTTPLVEWHTKMRGGYAGLLLSFILILLLYARIAYDNKTNVKNFLILGLLCGLAYYNTALILSLLISLVLASAYWRKVFWHWKSVVLFAVGCVIGAAPLIQYELVNNFENTRFVLGLGSNPDTSSLSVNLIKLFTKYIPAFFVGRNVDQYIAKPPAQAWIEYLIYAGIFCYALYICWDSFQVIFTSWIPFRHTTIAQNPPKPESLLVLSVLMHLAVCIISTNTALSPRYLLALFPALSILAGSTIQGMWQNTSKLATSTAAVIFAVLMGLGIITHTSYIKPSTVTDDVLLTNGQIVNVQTTGKSATAIIDFLRQQDISSVRTAYFIQWRIIFESQETIIASSNGFIPGLSRYREYDEQVDQAQQIAIIYHRDSAQLQDFSRTETAKQLAQTQIYEYIVYYTSPD